MTDALAARLKSAAVPDPDFDRLTLAEKRAWLQVYLDEGRAQLAKGQSVSLESDAEIEALFERIRAEAHEESGPDK